MGGFEWSCKSDSASRSSLAGGVIKLMEARRWWRHRAVKAAIVLGAGLLIVLLLMITLVHLKVYYMNGSVAAAAAAAAEGVRDGSKASPSEQFEIVKRNLRSGHASWHRVPSSPNPIQNSIGD